MSAVSMGKDLIEFKSVNFDIVILGGQSNAQGCGMGEVTEEYVPDRRILTLSDKTNPHFEKDGTGKDYIAFELCGDMVVSMADETVGESGKMGKFALIFAKRYIQSGLLKDGRKLLIIDSALGGTGFARNEWGETGSMYVRLKKLTDAALALNQNNRIVAFLWHQGECDAFENSDWSAKKRYAEQKLGLNAMLNDFYSSYNCKGLPFIAGGFCDEWYLQNKTSCDAVLKAVKEICAQYNGAFIETSGLLSNNQKIGNGDIIHFCREAQYILGLKYFKAYKKICRCLEPE